MILVHSIRFSTAAIADKLPSPGTQLAERLYGVTGRSSPGKDIHLNHYWLSGILRKLQNSNWLEG
jgi:hypothetical protein